MSEGSNPQLRRSARNRKQTVAYNEEVEDEGDRVSKPSPKKRRKTTNSRRKVDAVEEKSTNTRRARGPLQRLKEIPLDVVFVIFGYLNPQDLLHLSRTNKDLRNLLLSRSTILVWKEARSNVEGLPDIPEDLSEPAYAHLCFDTQCYLCGNKNLTINLLWHDRTRACKNCIEQSQRQRRPRIIWFSVQVDLHPQALEQRQLAIPDSLPTRFWKILRYRGDIVSFHERRQWSDRLVCSRASHQQLVREWNANKNDPVWFERKMAEGKARHKHALKLGEWWKRRLREHDVELVAKRKAREEAILQRLSDIGWKEELDLQRPLNNLRFFKKFRIGTQAKKLTEKDWNDLRPQLEEALQKARNNRLMMELRARWKRRYEKFKNLLQAELDKAPFNTVGPSVFDIASLPQFQEKLLLPIEHDLTEEDLSALFPEIPQIRDRWVRAREEDLVEHLRKSGVANPTRDMLRCATTIFVCAECKSPCVYPRPLIHVCSRGRFSCWEFFSQNWRTPSFSDFLDATYGAIWNVSDYEYSDTWATAARNILSATDLPVDATVEDIRTADLWLECPGPNQCHLFCTPMQAV
ncbi:hypothetical protein V5O48_018246 [Marasmius crinis-equi]|uniref:F-box domain-containing protein n=1 Tax=Marasmius crinis-equi TaxID=585013 RepID=A0ABR3ELQ0_9AGAR